MFIVFEGIDGAGTTTQARLLAESLEQTGCSVSLTAEPTDKAIGRFIREILSGQSKIPQRALQMLFFADRIQHLEEDILPALQKGKIVISDRYYLSTLAYARLADKSSLFADIAKHFPEPDLTIFLDLPVTAAMQRIETRAHQKEIFEKAEFLERIAIAYRESLRQVANEKKLVLDGTKSKATLAEAIFHEVRGRSSAG